MAFEFDAVEILNCEARRPRNNLGKISQWSHLTSFDVAYLEAKAAIAKSMVFHETPFGPFEAAAGERMFGLLGEGRSWVP
jgi:hypothetical protein